MVKSFQLPTNLFDEQSDGTLFTGGTYHDKLAYPFVDLDFSAYIWNNWYKKVILILQVKFRLVMQMIWNTGVWWLKFIMALLGDQLDWTDMIQYWIMVQYLDGADIAVDFQ